MKIVSTTPKKRCRPLVSPCHLSSIPLVIGYLIKQEDEAARRPFILSFVFALGILLTIGLIGAITTLMGRMMGDVGIWGQIFVSAVFFVVGLYLMDVVPLSWGELMPSGTSFRGRKGALVLGLIFGIGLGPCTFAFMAPVLAVVFTVGAAEPMHSLSLIAAFGIGHCAVIAGAGGTAGSVQRYLRWTGNSQRAVWTKRAAGVLVMLGGIYNLSTVF